MKKSIKIAIVSVIIAAGVISALAVMVHLRLSAIEGNEGNKQESAEQKLKEIGETLTNQNVTHSESEENESTEQREKESSQS